MAMRSTNTCQQYLAKKIVYEKELNLGRSATESITTDCKISAYAVDKDLYGQPFLQFQVNWSWADT